MWVGLLCGATAGLCNSVLPFVFKRQGEREDRQLALQIGAALISVLVLAGVVLIGRLDLGSGLFLLTACCAGVLNSVNSLSYYSVVVHRGPVSVSWVVLWMGVILVAALGWLLLGEPVCVLQVAGLVTFLACLGAMGLALGRSAGGRGVPASMQVRKGYWPWLMIALLAGAGATFLLGLHDKIPGHGDKLAFILVNFAGALATAVAFCLVRRIRPARDAGTVGRSAMASAVTLTLLIAFLFGLHDMPISQLFPITAAVAITMGVVWSVLRGERPTGLVYLGAVLAIVSIVLINLQGPVLWRR